ncbi:helix-turn-helix domain-containing protein [Paenibacillus lactis]|uniref:helix-turn-helix domain-containing protein n=1 Tax=Paenibacillus lactis TaxID=228574 RepID=UPI001FCFCE0A|nr:helix-turn-helix transcriptional regulator [Paenibacillus lactis]
MIDGSTFRKLREVYRMTREDFGALMNVTGRFVSYVESGDRKLPQHRADMLVRELDLTPEKLARLMAIYNETTIQTQ